LGLAMPSLSERFSFFSARFFSFSTLSLPMMTIVKKNGGREVVGWCLMVRREKVRCATLAPK
jgi:hypothetical protein